MLNNSLAYWLYYGNGVNKGPGDILLSNQFINIDTDDFQIVISKRYTDKLSSKFWTCSFCFDLIGSS